VRHPRFDLALETIILPRGGEGFSVEGCDEDRTVAGREFKRHTRIDKGVFEGQASVRSLTDEMPFVDKAAATDVLREIHGVEVYVVGPEHWRDNDKERDILAVRTPATPSAFAAHGFALFERRGDYDGALKDFAEAIRNKPGLAVAWNDRCFVRAEANRELEQALADCNEALRLQPKAAYIMDSRGMVYFRMGKLHEAQKDYGAALAIDPGLAPTLFMRGVVKRRKGLQAEGDADIKAAQAIEPDVGKDYVKFGIVG
jgi:tetratricopeptide (TPR) repeat protein